MSRFLDGFYLFLWEVFFLIAFMGLFSVVMVGFASLVLTVGSLFGVVLNP